MRTENNCSACGIAIPFKKRKCKHCKINAEEIKKREKKTPHRSNGGGSTKINMWSV